MSEAELNPRGEVALRALRSDDRERLEASFARLSETSRYRRFFLHMGSLPPRLLDQLLDVDHHDREAIVAVRTPPDGGEEQILGVARFARLAGRADTADVAVTVVDDWQGRGLGRALLDALVTRAREEGVGYLAADVLAENRGAARLLATLGHTERHLDHGVIEMLVELPPQRGIGPWLRNALREAGAGALVPARTLGERLADSR